MRCRPVRFGLGSLLFAVALVAANIAAFRPFYLTDEFSSESVSFRLLDAEVGAIPLFNVAAAGLWAGASRRIRVKSRPESPPRPAFPWVGFLAAQLLLMGWLATWFLAAELLDERQALRDATNSVAEAWAGPFGSPDGTTSWLICETSLLGVLVSGPALFLAGIGRMLMSRSAARLPRARFRVLVGLIAIGFAAADLAICVVPQPASDEPIEVPLEFRVVDASSGRPIPAALVRVVDPFRVDPGCQHPSASANETGLARMTASFQVEGHVNAFQILGTVSPWGRWLEVTAPGYRSRRVPLAEVLGHAVDPDGPGRREVALAIGAGPDEPCRDLAGAYSAGGFSGETLKIEPDGRFVWADGGCTGPYVEEYGHLSRRGATVEFVPVPHPGRENAPEVSVRYCTIRWGGDVFLTPLNFDGFTGWCRAVQAAAAPIRSRFVPGSLLRSSNRHESGLELPHIPGEVWAKMLAGDLVVTTPTDAWRLVSNRVAAFLGDVER